MKNTCPSDCCIRNRGSKRNGGGWNTMLTKCANMLHKDHGSWIHKDHRFLSWCVPYTQHKDLAQEWLVFSCDTPLHFNENVAGASYHRPPHILYTYLILVWALHGEAVLWTGEGNMGCEMSAYGWRWMGVIGGRWLTAVGEETIQFQ